MDKEIIVIAGPTAVGKTKYAIEIAKELSGEIVSADSMQLYKLMNIGSAKPTAQELSQARHHLIDEIDPRTPFSVAEYQKRAKKAIFEIFSRGKKPVISGGTGLYINSLIYDMDFAMPPLNNGYREKLEEIAKEKGGGALHEILLRKDSEAAARIHPNNIKKMIRALEVCENSNMRVKGFEESFVKTKDYDYVIICLDRDRQELYGRINHRVDLLIEAGLADEVRSLLDLGLSDSDISMKGIGYKELIAYFNGEYDISEAILQIKQNTRRYAKRQLTWLRRFKDAKWFRLSEYENDEIAIQEVLKWLQKR